MATDTSFGEVRKFEDFLVTAVADLPEIDIKALAGGTTEVTAGADGLLRIAGDGTDDEACGAVSFGVIGWMAGDAYLKMEARIYISAITDYKIFVGFGGSIASSAETSFSATSDVVTIDTMANGIGLLWDGDQTTDRLWAVAGATDVVTVNKGLDVIYNPVATTFTTLGCYLSLDRKSAVFYVDGTEVYRIDSDTVLVAAVGLVPGVWVYDQGTATNIDVDYLYGAKGRSSD
uniref:Uncharacterized protein n=1 Tax=viral metagenome TaxID=1070528 RepID=A0A6M3IH31_9ZZZZ